MLMKYIKYKKQVKVNVGTKESPVWEERIFPKKLICCDEAAIAKAKREAYNGEITIVDEEV